MTRPLRPQRIAESTADALRRGDPHAFEDLYLGLRGDVYNLAARIVGDRGEAEDITQEVFLRAFRHLPGKAGQVRPEAWVFKTTVNACFDHLRRRRTATVETVADAHIAGPDGFEQAATAAAVEAALGRLNPRYRAALVLKELHGLGNAEIAEAMGVTRGTVGVLLFRARRAFERRYREVAPSLGAGAPVAGLAVWLPPLPLPSSLAGTPAFFAPLAATPSMPPPAALPPVAAAAPASAPLAAASAPLAGALAKVSAAVTSKVVLAALAVTAVTGGGMAIDHVGQADPVHGPTAALRVSFGDGWGGKDTGGSTAKTPRTLAASSPRSSGSGDGSSGAAPGGTTTRACAAHGRDGSGGGTDEGSKAGDGDGGQTQGGHGQRSSGGTEVSRDASGRDGSATRPRVATVAGLAEDTASGPADGSTAAGSGSGHVDLAVRGRG